MFTLNCKGRLLVIDVPVVMGIINTTPDSFYEGSRATTSNAVIEQAEKMLAAGATLLDIGGQSTRPGSEALSADQELQRILPAVEIISRHFPQALISIDTFHSTVARYAVEAGACIVNDISGGSLDANMLTTVAQLKVPYICMHMKGTPQTMQANASYQNIALEVVDHFIEKMELCKQAGIYDVIIDPGFGFSKTIPHNFELLRNLEALKIFDKPVLVGLSRKSTVYKPLGISPSEALNGTGVLNTIALLNGASILRVHDVKEAVEAVKLVKAYRK